MAKTEGLSAESKQHIASRIREVSGKLPTASDDTPGQMVEFMNTRAFGSRFVYVLDKSGSMAGRRLEYAKTELVRSLSSIDPEHSFYVIFYDSHAAPIPAEDYLRANDANRGLCAEWLGSITAGGKTRPVRAMVLALQKEPDAVFLLSDGLFDEDSVRTIRLLNGERESSGGGRARINTISFLSKKGARRLREIALGNEGQWLAVETPPRKGLRSVLWGFPARLFNR